jgi:hypothetical protein
MERPPVTVAQFFTEHARPLELKVVAGESLLARIIREPTVNRPGLALSGFTRYFAYKRVQVMGHAEVFYLRSLRQEERAARYAYLFAYKIPCVVFSRGLKPDREFLAAQRPQIKHLRMAHHLDALVGKIAREPAQRQAGAVHRRLANDPLEIAAGVEQLQLQRLGVFLEELFDREGGVFHGASYGWLVLNLRGHLAVTLD